MADLICANTTLAEVRSKIAAATTGDRVLIPAGTVTFTTGLSSVPGDADTSLFNKAIEIQGGYGGGVTTFVDQVPRPNPFPQRIYMMYWTTVNTGISTLRNITFVGTTSTDPNNSAQPSLFIRGNSTQFRFVNCTFKPIRSPIFYIRDSVYGGAFHCTFDESLHEAGTVNSYVFHPRWDGGTDDYGDRSWFLPNSMGTLQAFFYENCTANNPQTFGVIRWMTDGWLGSRVVVRHCNLTNMILGNHGTESSGRGRGGRQFEAYENTFSMKVFDPLTGNPSNTSDVIGLRGGSIIAFNNSVTTIMGSVGNVVSTAYLRAVQTHMPFGRTGKWTPTSITRVGNVATITGTHFYPSTWSYSTRPIWTRLENMTPSGYNGNWQVLSATTGSFTIQLASDPGSDVTVMGQVMSPWDGNTNNAGYMCLDQSGAGPSVMLPNTLDPTPPAGGMGQTAANRDPIYAWNNRVNGVLVPFRFNSGTGGLYTVGVDVIESPKPGYTTAIYPHPLNDFGGGSPDIDPPATPTGFVVS